MAFTTKAALDALRSDDLIALGMEADALRRTLHPQNTVTYVVLDAFPSGTPEEESSLLNCAGGLAECGATDIALPDRTSFPAFYEDLETGLRPLQARYPELAWHGPGAAAIATLAGETGAPVLAVLRRLQDAGVRSVGPQRADGLLPSSEDIFQVHRAAHRIGMLSSASLVIGRGETNEERVKQMNAVRELQEDTGGFVAFELQVHHPANPQARREEEVTAVDYLKTLAVARLMLESIPHVEAGWSTQGPKVLELALRFGADDAGAIAPRRVSFREAGHHGGEAELRRIIRDAGFMPVMRDLLYTRSFLHW